MRNVTVQIIKLKMFYSARGHVFFIPLPEHYKADTKPIKLFILIASLEWYKLNEKKNILNKITA